MQLPNLDIGERADSVGVPSMDKTTTSIFSIIFLLATSTMLDKQTVLLGFDLSSSLGATAFTVGGLGVSWAAIASLLSIAAVYSFNNRELKSFNDHQSHLAYVVIASVVILGISPPLRSWVASSDFLSYAVVAVLTIGYISISEMAELGGVRR